MGLNYIKKEHSAQPSKLVHKHLLENSASNENSSENLIKAKLDGEKPSAEIQLNFEHSKPDVSYDPKAVRKPIRTLRRQHKLSWCPK